MKKLVCAFVVVFGCGMFVGLLVQHRVPAQAEDGGGAAGSPLTDEHFCADVTGDGRLDISDAIRLLNWLFRHEQPPYCVEGGAGLSECEAEMARLKAALQECRLGVCRLPATGQTGCYRLNGRLTDDCEDVPCPGQDGFYQNGCKPARFIDHGDGTVTDTCTKLMWQKATPDINENGEIDAGDEVTWCEALEYCEDLELGDNGLGGMYDDWRLPNKFEIDSIHDYGRTDAPLIYVEYFEAHGGPYWSSTTFPIAVDGLNTEAFVGAFGSGSQFRKLPKDATLHFRAVRTIQPGE